jgi:hypothetical protein
MTCRDLDKLLASQGSTAIAAARNHAAICPRCRDLLQAIAVDEASGSGDLRPELANSIARRMADDLAAVKPLPSARYFTAVFALVSIALAFAVGIALSPHAWPLMTASMAAIVYGSLAICVVLLSAALSRQMFPASRHPIPTRVLALGVLVGIAIVFAAVFSTVEESDFWMHAWVCLRAGLVTGVAASVFFWFILRRGAVLEGGACGALAGLLGGLTGTAMLEIHCPDFNLSHILAGHWGAAALGAGIGWAVGSLAGRRR